MASGWLTPDAAEQIGGTLGGIAGGYFGGAGGSGVAPPSSTCPAAAPNCSIYSPGTN